MVLRLVNPVPLPLSELAPPARLFLSPSRTHGPAHVARVLVHAFVLLEATGRREEGLRLWAAVWLHDLARTHDGPCRRHGRDAAERLARLPEALDLFARAGLTPADLEAVRYAVARHVGAPEPPLTEPFGPLTLLLKDADGLDRVRLGDLDPRFLRFAPTASLVPFAEALLEATEHGPQGALPEGPDLFPRVYAAAEAALARWAPRGLSSRTSGA